MLRSNTPPFDQKPMVVVPWKENMEVRSDIERVPVWVQFPHLPLKFWGAENLCRLASQLGKPLEIDLLTLKRDRAQFARVQILMEITEELVEMVKYFDEEGRIQSQRVSYEWKPVRCKTCRGYGHGVSECRHGKKQIWVPKEQPKELTVTSKPPEQHVASKPSAPTQEWAQVQRKKDKGALSQPPDPSGGGQLRKEEELVDNGTPLPTI